MSDELQEAAPVVDIRDALEFLYEDHIVWAVVKEKDTIIARERIPLHYLKQDMSPTLSEFYMQEIAGKLRKKLERSGKMPSGKTIN